MTTKVTEDNESIGLEPRDVRALTECMTVLENVGRVRDAVALYLVISESDVEYLVNVRSGTCECPDCQMRGFHCKHARRVRFAIGDRPIPSWVDTDMIDPNLAGCVAPTPRVVAADGGQVFHENENDERSEGRPDECECYSDDTLPCFTCWMAGFDAPNAVNE